MKYNFIEKRVIKNFVKLINPDYKVKFEGSAFECDVDEQVVYIGERKFNYDGKMFMDWFKQEFPVCKDINWWIISLLHEIGHIETSTDELQEERDLLYSTLKAVFDFGTTTVEEMNKAYFQIPCEYQATDWGANWWLEHKKECQKLVKFLKIGVN